MLSLSRFFQPFFTTRPLSQIIYVGSRAKPKYQKLLNDVGKQLGIPVHWCLGGLASEKFRRNWERHRREHERREAEEAEEEEDEEEEDDEENAAAAAAEEEERRQRDEAAAAAAATTLPESMRHGRHLSANDSSVRLDDATDQNGSRQSARVFEATRAATTGATAAATSTAAALSPSATRRTRKSATADISATGTRHLERRPTAGRHVSFTNHHDDDNNDVIARGRRPRHLDTCAQFIRNMLQRHKNQRKRGGTTSTATTPTSASSSAATPLVTDYVKTTLLNKNHRASKRLNARPKIGSLKKASQFLTLRDRSLNRLGFLALAAQRPPSSTTKQQQPLRSSSRTGWGGAMVTRAATGSLPSGSTTTTPTPSPAARRRRRHQPKATTTTTKRRRSRTNDDDGDDDDDVDEDEKASKNQKRTTTATTTNKTTMTRGRGQRRRRQNGNRVKFLVDDNEEKHRDGLYHDDDDDNNDDDDDGDGKIHLSREDEAIVNRTIDAEEAESFDFLPDSLLLFDDCLVPISPLDHQRLPGSTTHNATASSSSSSSSSSPSSTINTRNKNNNNSNNAARQTQNAFTEALQFFSSLALEHAHHDSLHFVVTSQSVLSSAGTSAVARCFKTLRQNIDAHIVFDQPLQDARSFFKNLVSGAGEFEESRGIPLLITLKKMVDIFSPIFYLLLSF